MKKTIYITLFTLLGVMLGFLLHSLLEIPIIALLLSDFERWGMGLSWETWEMIHDVATSVLLVVGAVLGFKQGRHWWNSFAKDK